MAHSKESTCNAGDSGDEDLIPGLGRASGKGHGTHSSTFAWGIPQSEEPGSLQSMGLQSVRQD